MSGPLLNVEQVAARLNCSPKTVRRLAYTGKLRYRRLVRELRFEQSWVQDFIDNGPPLLTPQRQNMQKTQ